VLRAESGFAARQGDIDIEAFEDKDTKGTTYSV
jgi:hypothetical protein